MSTISNLTGFSNDTANGIVLRSNAGGPLTHDQVDTNWSRIGSKVNACISGIEANSTSITDIQNTFLQSLPAAGASTLGGVSVSADSGINLSTSGAISLNTGTVQTLIDAWGSGDGKSAVVAYAMITGISGTNSTNSLHNCTLSISADGVYVIRVATSYVPNDIVVPLCSSISPNDFEMAPVLKRVQKVGGNWEIEVHQLHSSYHSAKDGDTHWANPFAGDATSLFVAVIGK